MQNGTSNKVECQASISGSLTEAKSNKIMSHNFNLIKNQHIITIENKLYWNIVEMPPNQCN